MISKGMSSPLLRDARFASALRVYNYHLLNLIVQP